MAEDRLRCAIPGCQRTRHNREGFSGWICGPHWRMGPKTLRDLRTLAKRRKRYRLADRLWDRIRAHIIRDLQGII